MVGERAADIVQVAAIAMTARMRVDDLARVAISFPTYAEVLFNTAVRAADRARLASKRAGGTRGRVNITPPWRLPCPK